MGFDLTDLKGLMAPVSINRGVKTLLLRVDCDKCFKWDCVACYSKDVGVMDFTVSFFQCKKCDKIACEICMRGEGGEELACPFCGHEGMGEVKPYKLYTCNMCVDEEKYCDECEIEA